MTDTPDATPAEAIAAMTRAVQAYEPEATGAVIASPRHLLSVLLEASRRAVDAAAPVIAARTAAAERERIRDQLSAAITDLRDAGDERRAMWLGALADLLAAEPQETP